LDQKGTRRLAGVRVVLLGPPGAGKGTQAKLLQEMFDSCQIATGDILRKAVAEQSPLGKQAGEYVNRGALVPDGLIVDLVAERLKDKDCEKGFILDGFPRTLSQAQSLDAILTSSGLRLDTVVYVRVPRELIVERLAGRRTCARCGALHHLTFNPPKAGVCDRCGGDLVQRDDDREETIRARLHVYETQTAPLVNYYKERGMLREVDGAGDVQEVQGRMLQALEIAA
jgi:adenylate kinase